MVIFKAIPQPIGYELDVESYMVENVFESSFQNIKRIAIPSFVGEVMPVLVKICQSAKTGKNNRLNQAISQLNLQFS